ncbi:Soluble quino glucose sorbosone dehydrogenase [Cordyceps militaris]|uniref:Soluble quino glucose sorbosone dehydrogenase n=1 Tax=Cordyceps militaris TaxID=73501 RepID=A0A2H4S8D2_CORMI|nr:Soluble quino glucose sorbosone dehydrogenase [Cordyceps militaris]
MPPEEAPAGSESRTSSHYLSLRSRRSNRYLADATKQSAHHDEPPLPLQQYAPQQLLLQLPQQTLTPKSSKRSLRSIFSRSKLTKDKAEQPTTAQPLRQSDLSIVETATPDNRTASNVHIPLATESQNSPSSAKRASSVPRSRSLRRQSHALPPVMPTRKASVQDNTSRDSLAAWEMPPLFKAFPQTIRQATLPTVTMSTEMVLRLHEKNISAAVAAEQLTIEERTSREKTKKKHGKNPSLSNLHWTSKIYLLTTSGHLLQYAGAGNYDRLPEKVLKLSQTSAAFVTDSIPGKHWVLQVSSEPDAVIPANEPKSILSKLSILGGDKRATANILMVFESPDDLDSWMATLRGEIQKLGGRRKLSETGVPEPPAARRPAPRTMVVRDSMRFSRSPSRHQESSGDDDLTLKVSDFQHSRDQSLDEISTTNSIVSQDGQQLDNLRDSNGNRLSFASADRRTAVTSAASTPERSPIVDTFPRDSSETCDSREYTHGSKKGDVKPRPNASVIASRRSTMQNAGLFIDVSSEKRNSQSEEDPFSYKSSEGPESPTSLVAPNFSVPQSSNRRFSHMRMNSTTSQSPPSPNTATFASRLIRSKPPPVLRSSRPLSMVTDHKSPRTELPARPPTADGTSHHRLSPVKEQVREQRQRCSRRHSPRSSADAKSDISSPRSSLAMSDRVTSPLPGYRISPRRSRPPVASLRKSSPESDMHAMRTSKRLPSTPHELANAPVFAWTRDMSRRQSTAGSFPCEPLALQKEMRRASINTGFTPLGHRRHSSDEMRPVSVLPPMPPPPSGPLPALPDYSALPLAAGSLAGLGMRAPSDLPLSEAGDAKGVAWKVLTNDIRRPRGLVQDSLGNILVVEGKGVRRLELNDAEGMDLCIKNSTQLIVEETLNHGIALTADGKTLFASSSTDVYAYTYDAKTGVAGPARNVITGMNQTGHVSRTLYIPPANPDLLLVSRGSNDNVDADTADIESGRSQLRVFRIADLVGGKQAVTYTDGDVLGWGLRNSVGMGQDPTTGNIWSVENSIDNLHRFGADIHNSNPGEEMNFHGRPNDTEGYHYGRNFGYPGCLSMFDTTNVKKYADGTLLGPVVSTTRHAAAHYFWLAPSAAGYPISPRWERGAYFISRKLASQNWSPSALDAGLWLTLMTRNRQPPNGYRLSRVSFANGNPRKRSHAGDAEEMLMWNADNSDCRNHCFRPVGLLLDKQGRLFMTSDATGELFLVTGTQNNGVPSNP